MNNEDAYDDYNVFIRQCVNQLIEDRVCYCYHKEQVDDIKKRFNKKYDLNIYVMENDIGYTLSIKNTFKKRKNIV